MDIRRADEIDWKPAHHCPTCGVAVLPSGKGEPFVVNGVGVYCRDHGAGAHPDYAVELAEYGRWREAVAAYREWSEGATAR